MSRGGGSKANKEPGSVWAPGGSCVWPQAFCCPPLGSSISCLPLLAAMIAHSRRALLPVNPVDEGKARSSHLAGEGHIIKNVEGCWIRQAVPQFKSCSHELLRAFFFFFLIRLLEEFFGRLSLLSSVQQCRESRLLSGFCIATDTARVAMAQQEFGSVEVLTQYCTG